MGALRKHDWDETPSRRRSDSDPPVSDIGTELLDVPAVRHRDLRTVAGRHGEVAAPGLRPPRTPVGFSPAQLGVGAAAARPLR